MRGLAGGFAGCARHPPPRRPLGADHPQLPLGALPAQGPEAPNDPPGGVGGGGGAQQQPAAAVEAADHTGDLAMASAVSAAVDVDEADEDIL